MAELIEENCPLCQNEINNTIIGISILMADIRNYIRFNGDIIIINKKIMEEYKL